MSTGKKGIETVLKRLPTKSRFQFFSLFIFLSFTFWASTKLSKQYQLVQSFVVVWNQVPKGIVLSNTPTQIKMTLKASGVEILWYRLFKNKVALSLQALDIASNAKVLSLEDQYFDLQDQLFGGTEVLQITPSLFPVEYSKMEAKKFPIRADIDLVFRPGYLGAEEAQLTPDSVVVMGPKNILDTLTTISTEQFKAMDVHQNINQKIALEQLNGLEFDQGTTQLSWTVLPYSEKTFSIALEVQNLPEGVKVKLFPPEATLRATLPLSLLSTVQPSDFALGVNFNAIEKESTETLEVQLLKQPPAVKKIIWEPQRVNFLIRR